jgi:hypothetical protein
LTIVKTASLSSVPSGTPFSYQLIVRNVGPGGASFVRVLDALPADFIVTGFGTERGTCAIVGSLQGGVLDCDLGSIGIGAGASATVDVTGHFQVFADAKPLNTAIVDPDGLVQETREDNNRAVLTVQALAVSDLDGDGCTNIQELGANPVLGGMRDPYNGWDFFDTPPFDRAVSIADIDRILDRFGAVAGFPGPPAYGAPFDRRPIGPNDWNIGPPDGRITIVDITLSVLQFSHTCATP